LQIFGKRQIMN